MRLWSLDPAILDRAALIACWREALLAQKVLTGGTRGYTRHPQLARFRSHDQPLDAIGAYLVGLQAEARRRGYRFDASRITAAQDPAEVAAIPVTEGQLVYELGHLRAKVELRAPEQLDRLPADGERVPAHPLLQVVPGGVEDFEVIPSS